MCLRMEISGGNQGLFEEIASRKIEEGQNSILKEGNGRGLRDCLSLRSYVGNIEFNI